MNIQNIARKSALLTAMIGIVVGFPLISSSAVSESSDGQKILRDEVNGFEFALPENFITVPGTLAALGARFFGLIVIDDSQNFTFSVWTEKGMPRGIDDVKIIAPLANDSFFVFDSQNNLFRGTGFVAGQEVRPTVRTEEGNDVFVFTDGDAGLSVKIFLIANREKDHWIAIGTVKEAGQIELNRLEDEIVRFEQNLDEIVKSVKTF